MSTLRVRDLVTTLHLRAGSFNVVDGISLEVGRGETVGLVGESGAGKTFVLRSIIHALPAKAEITNGTILFNERDITRISGRALRGIRGREIAMIFQDPVSALNPVIPIGEQLMETLEKVYGIRRRRESRRRAIELLRVTGVPEPDLRFRAYPHELSGGMAQRVVIALALVGEPQLLLADEPTSALDVTVQAQLLTLLLNLQQQFGMSILIVSHDLGVIAQTCSRLYVMYAGHIVEHGTANSLFTGSRHPFTQGLLASLPGIDAERAVTDLPALSGAPANSADPPSGCRFHPRCPLVIDACTTQDVQLVSIEANHHSACIRHEIVSAESIRRISRLNRDP